jgi:DNA-binding CsgD family transcriptional regulator
MSDFLARAEFHATAMYQEYYRLVGVEHQIAIFVTPARVRSVGFAISRDLRDFDERDRLMLNLLRPHLVAAYDRAAATACLHAQMGPLARAADIAAVGIVLLDRGNRIEHATRQARQWLRYYFAGRGRPSGTKLPPVVADWLARQKAVEAAPALTTPLEPLVVSRGDRRLVVRLLGAPGAPALLLEESRGGVDAAALKPLGLSAREREVLALVARGARNDEIGRRLGASPRTIAKHVERIHRKLGVDNRAAAAARAHEVAVAPRSRDVD